MPKIYQRLFLRFFNRERRLNAFVTAVIKALTSRSNLGRSALKTSYSFVSLFDFTCILTNSCITGFINPGCTGLLCFSIITEAI